MRSASVFSTRFRCVCVCAAIICCGRARAVSECGCCPAWLHCRRLRLDSKRSDLEWPLRVTMRERGAEVPGIPGTDASSLRALTALFEAAGLQDVATTTIEVTLSYVNFEAFWDAQTPSYSPTTRIITAMSAREREQLIERVRAALPRTGRLQSNMRH